MKLLIESLDAAVDVLLRINEYYEEEPVDVLNQFVYHYGDVVEPILKQIDSQTGTEYALRAEQALNDGESSIFRRTDSYTEVLQNIRNELMKTWYVNRVKLEI